MAASTAPTTPPKQPPPGAHLLPINLESAHERALLLAQRIICGWKADAEAHAEWRQYSVQGRRSMFWIALLLPSDASTASQYLGIDLTTATTAGRLLQRKVELECDDEEVEQGQGENGVAVESSAEVYVVGHVALDKEDFAGQHYGDLETGLTEDDGSVLTITTLFVLPAFRSLGLAGWAMLELQNYARDPRYGSRNCIAVTLDTLSDRYNKPDDPECVSLWRDMGYASVPRSNIPWYERLGFRRYGEERLRYRDAGGCWYAVYMRKDLV